jgi:hypothetical protein
VSHRCPARGCGTVVDDTKLMCRADWYLVPRPLRNAVLRAYAGGAGLGSAALCHAQDLAIRAVNREPEPGDAP